MRGQAGESCARQRDQGITPADAGTSARKDSGQQTAEDHPRGCGDKDDPIHPVGAGLGSPPRMRGQALDARELSARARITPADAGTSPFCFSLIPGRGDHPRGCGDKIG